MMLEICPVKTQALMIHNVLNNGEAILKETFMEYNSNYNLHANPSISLSITTY